MTQPDKRSHEREITYHVGWKKGRIQVQDKPGASALKADKPSDDPLSQAGSALPKPAFLTFIWKEVPYPSKRTASIMLAVLPAGAFGAILWLCSMLVRG